MKTKSVLDKYKKLVAGLLEVKADNVDFWIRKTDITPVPAWEKIGDSIPSRKLMNFAIGEYRMTVRDREASTWKLYQMPHCCGIIVSCNVHVVVDFRNKRLGSLLNTFRQELGRLLGYSCMMCTDIETNDHQRRILATNGWKDVHNVINKRTNNRIYISVINL